jgi:hypothetical protein
MGEDEQRSSGGRAGGEDGQLAFARHDLEANAGAKRREGGEQTPAEDQKPPQGIR